MKIDEEAIRKLADLLNETGLTEIEVADEGQSIRVSKGGMAMPMHAYPAQLSAMANDPGAPHKSAAPATTADHPGAVISPMVGTAYTAPEPGAPPFVTVGASVSEGDTLVIIEAMKVMNPIKAHKAGKIARIMIDTGRPVEYGDVLMVIE